MMSYSTDECRRFQPLIFNFCREAKWAADSLMRLVFYVSIYERTVFVGTIQSYKSDVQGRGVIIPNLPCETARGYYLHDFSLSH